MQTRSSIRSRCSTTTSRWEWGRTRTRIRIRISITRPRTWEDLCQVWTTQRSNWTKLMNPSDTARHSGKAWWLNQSRLCPRTKRNRWRAHLLRSENTKPFYRVAPCPQIDSSKCSVTSETGALSATDSPWIRSKSGLAVSPTLLTDLVWSRTSSKSPRSSKLYVKVTLTMCETQQTALPKIRTPQTRSTTELYPTACCPNSLMDLHPTNALPKSRSRCPQCRARRRPLVTLGPSWTDLKETNRI